MPRWITLKQATQYCNIGKQHLINLVKNQEIHGFQDLSLKKRPWRLDKESIDTYMEGQVVQHHLLDEEDQKVVDKIVSSLPPNLFD